MNTSIISTIVSIERQNQRTDEPTEILIGGVYGDIAKLLTSGDVIRMFAVVSLRPQGDSRALEYTRVFDEVYIPLASCRAIVPLTEGSRALQQYERVTTEHNREETVETLNTTETVDHMTTSALVIYHGHCADGACAAWIAHKALRSIGLDVTMWPMGYQDATPWDLIDAAQAVYIVDFSLPEADLLKIAEQGKLSRLLDHHKTRAEFLKTQTWATFDENMSGAGLTWAHFYSDHEEPWFVSLVQDRDLWRFNFEASKDFHLYIIANEFKPELFEELLVEHGRGVEVPARIVTICTQMAKVRSHAVAQAVRSAITLGVFPNTGHPHDVRCAHVTLFHSEIGHALCDDAHPVSLTWRIIDGGSRVSLSWRSDGRVDVGAYAAALGGGGHKAAAGCVLKLNTWLEILKNKEFRW